MRGRLPPRMARRWWRSHGRSSAGTAPAGGRRRAEFPRTHHHPVVPMVRRRRRWRRAACVWNAGGSDSPPMAHRFAMRPARGRCCAALMRWIRPGSGSAVVRVPRAAVVDVGVRCRRPATAAFRPRQLPTLEGAIGAASALAWWHACAVPFGLVAVRSHRVALRGGRPPGAARARCRPGGHPILLRIPLGRRCRVVSEGPFH